MHAQTEARFAAAVLAPGAGPPPGLLATRRRFRLYQANVTAALTGALATRFPVSVEIVGADFFRAMAAEFVRISPPRPPVLLDYGDDLPAFAAGFAPAAGVPYLADVIRLEIARSQALHAADARPASVIDLAALRPEDIPATRVRFHPAARLIASQHPVATIAAWHTPGAERQPIAAWSGEEVLVTRPRLMVLTHVLRPGTFVFLERLFAGQTIAEAVCAATAGAPDFDAAAALAGLVSSGAVLSFHQGVNP